MSLSGIVNNVTNWFFGSREVTPLFKNQECRQIPQQNTYHSQSTKSNKILNQQDAAVRSFNHYISAHLHGCRFKSALIRKTNEGIISFSFTTNGPGSKKTIDFLDEKEMNEWLFAQQLVDVWEIIDCQDRKRIYYKLMQLDESGYEDKTKDELYSKLNEKYGDLFKLDNLDNDHDTKFIQVKTGISGHPYYLEVSFDNLYYIAKNMKLQNDSVLPQKIVKKKVHPTPPTNYLKIASVAAFVFLLFDTGFLKMMGTAIAYGLTARSGNSQVFRNSVFISELAHLIAQVNMQNLPPYVSQPIGDIIVNPGVPIELSNLQNIFSDPDKDTLHVTFSTVPPDFILVNRDPSVFVNTINETASVSKVVVNGTLLHVFKFSGNYEIWNISNINEPKKLSTFVNLNYLADGVTDGNYAYLSTGNGRVVDISDPNLPLYGADFSSEIANPGNLALDPTRQILWVIGSTFGNQLFGVNISDPTNPTLLSSTTVPNSYTCYIALDNDNNLYVVGGYQRGLRIYNATDPTNPNVINFNELYDVSEGIAYQDKKVYIAERYLGTLIYDVSTSNATYLGSVNEGGIITSDSVAKSGQYVYSSYSATGVDSNKVTMINALNPSNPIIYTDIFFPNGTIPTRVEVDGNRIFVATNNGVSVYDVDTLNMTGIPTPEDRGLFPIILTANDGRGGTVDYHFNIIVQSGNITIAKPIPDQNAEVGVPFNLQVNATDTFNAPAGDPISLSVNGLPAWLHFANDTFTGTPSNKDVGSDQVNLIATDPFVGNITDSFQIRVKPSNNTSSTTGSTSSTTGKTDQKTSSSNTNISPLIIGVSVAGGIMLFLIVGGTLIYLGRKKDRQNKIHFPAENFELSLQERKNITSVFGDANYGWIDFTKEEEKEKLFQATGAILENDEGIIGKGNYGVIRICWSFKENDYVAAKTVEGKENCAASKGEADLQRKAQGPGVWPILNTIVDEKNNKLVHLMPYASLDNLDRIRQMIREAGREKEVENFASVIAKNVLQGLVTLHKQKIYHCDLKGSNVLGDHKGVIGITDFGCSIASDSGIIEPRVSDYRYQSPSRLIGESLSEIKKIPGKLDVS